MLRPTYAAKGATPLPLWAVAPADIDTILSTLPDPAAAWARAQGFAAKPGETLTLPDATGGLWGALVGIGSAAARSRGRFQMGAAASKLPAGDWQMFGVSGPDLEEATLGWLLETYRFDRYKSQDRPAARLLAPDGIDSARILAIATGEWLTRDLINTPASDMGPQNIEAAARAVAAEHGCDVTVITGESLLDQNFPMIHAVGRASDRAPRLIDMRHGTKGPRLTLVGKGVCFDTGGLDIKPASSMGLMKKDMGGAAAVLGLAHMILSLGLDIQLRVLIPAVENSISGNAFRPQDILISRKGLSVEINNTDAEGRLVLADALAYASEEAPDLVISMATLTGAARVAVGPDLAPFFTDSDAHAIALSRGAATTADPVWRLPFHTPYETLIEPGIADLDNAPGGGMAGAITAALFLRRFTATPYIHFDIYGWQPTAAPGRPKGGVGQGTRAILAALPEMLGL